MKNSRFKFRAWNSLTNSMMYNLKDMGKFVLRDPSINDDFLVLPDTECYPLMQFTGLFDKQGVEIYEGDILIADKKDSKNKDWISVVEHNNYGGLCLYYYEYRNTLDRQFASCIQDHQTATWVMQSCEVIGNIYEHGHLLDNSKNKHGKKQWMD